MSSTLVLIIVFSFILFNIFSIYFVYNYIRVLRLKKAIKTIKACLLNDLIEIKKDESLVKIYKNKKSLGFLSTFIINYCALKKVHKDDLKDVLNALFYDIFKKNEILNLLNEVTNLLSKKDKAFVEGAREGDIAAKRLFLGEINIYWKNYLTYLIKEK